MFLHFLLLKIFLCAQNTINPQSTPNQPISELKRKQTIELCDTLMNVEKIKVEFSEEQNLESFLANKTKINHKIPCNGYERVGLRMWTTKNWTPRE